MQYELGITNCEGNANQKTTLRFCLIPVVLVLKRQRVTTAGENVKTGELLHIVDGNAH